MRVLYLVLYILAAVCFAVAAFSRSTVDSNGTREGGRGLALLPLGLLLWVLVPLIQTLQSVDD